MVRFSKWNLFPRSFLGLILVHSLKSTGNIRENKKIQVNITKNKQKIFDFYKKNEQEFSMEVIKNRLSGNCRCWIAQIAGETVGITWIWSNEVTLKALSCRCFSLKKTIYINSDAIYASGTIVLDRMRGKGVGQAIFRTIVIEYKKNKKVNKLFFSVGATNEPMIRMSMKVGCQLIGIVRIRSILGYNNRKIIFLDRKEICWK